MTPLYAIDPGTEDSALVEMIDGRIAGGIWPNHTLLAYLRAKEIESGAHLVIEQVESFGMAVGREVFETVFWSGRFAEAWDARAGAWSMLPRRTVKLTLCGSARAKDPNVRRALIDRYGGDASIRKGGPLYGITSHSWAALALAVTYDEQQREGKTATA